MGPVKLQFVVSFSSQDKFHKVSNLLVEGPKRWLTDPQDRTGQIEAIFQLEQPCCLAYIDIAQFSKEGTVSSSSWDRIQVVGRQPWRKDVQLGLSFLRVRGAEGSAASTTTSVNSHPLSTSSDENSGEKLSVDAIKEKFFGSVVDKDEKDNGLKKRLQKIAATSEGGSDNPDALSRNARMVLLANKACTKPAQRSVQRQPEVSAFAEEAKGFLGTLNIQKQDIDSLRVSDLRHKLEKQKWRKLTADEKRIFYDCCQDFIGSLFEDGSSPSSVTGAPPALPSPCPANSPLNKEKTNESALKGLVRKFRNDAAGDSGSAKGNGGCVATSIKNSDHGRRASDVHTSEPSGGFLTSGCVPSRSLSKTPRPRSSVKETSPVQRPAGVKEQKNVAAERNNKSRLLEGKCGTTAQTGCNTPTESSSFDRTSPMVKRNSYASAGPTPDRTESTPSKSRVAYCGDSSGGKNSVTPSRSAVKPNVLKAKIGKSLNNVHSCTSSGSDRKNTGQAAPLSKPASISKSTFLSSDSSSYSKIDKSLLNSHKQFLKTRMRNVCSSKPKPPSTDQQSSFTEELAGFELYLSSPEEISGTTETEESAAAVSKTKGTKSRGSTFSAKRPGSPLTSSENLAPSKRCLQFTDSEKKRSPVTALEDGEWLSARRGPQKDGDGPGASSSKTRGKKSSAKQPSASRAYEKSRGGGRGRDGVRRRLEMPSESAITISPASSPPSSPDNSVSSVFAGELQIDEDADFVECPLCGDMFPGDTVSVHASDCRGHSPQQVVSDGVSFVQCPLCQDMFDEAVIAQHASACGL